MNLREASTSKHQVLCGTLRSCRNSQTLHVISRGSPENGWGGEDDEMQKRLETLGIKWVAPDRGTIVDLEDMDVGTKMAFLKKNKQWKCMVKWEALDEHAQTWETNGLKDLSYDIKMIKRLDREDGGESKVTKLTVDVKLNGNHWANEKCGVDYLPS